MIVAGCNYSNGRGLATVKEVERRGEVESAPWYAAIEAGGTKWRVAVGRSRTLVADTTIPTTDPGSTISACVEFIRRSNFPISGVGIASFGPLDLDPDSPTYGFITATPKPGWSNTNVKSRIEHELDVPAVMEIDVGGAALGEWQWGASSGLDSFLYLTVGTGIGGAAMHGGRTFHDHGHPEMGHIAVEREKGDSFEGHCPFHGSCLEGMAAGPAIGARWGRPTDQLADRPEVWELEARYLAQGVRTLVYVLAPERILLGGGVMQQTGLLERVRLHLGEQLGGYGPSPSDLDRFVMAPELGQDAGLMGALALAHRHFEGT